MNFANNKKKRNLFAATMNIIRKRLQLKAIKSKEQYWVGDIFINKMDSQYNNLKYRKNDREIHCK